MTHLTEPTQAEKIQALEETVRRLVDERDRAIRRAEALDTMLAPTAAENRRLAADNGRLSQRCTELEAQTDLAQQHAEREPRRWLLGRIGGRAL